MAPKSLQSLPPLQGSALVMIDRSEEWLQQPSRSEEETQAFDEVITLALLKKTASNVAEPETSDENGEKDFNEKPQVTAGLIPLQDAWLAAMSMMPVQPATTWPAPDSGGDTANDSASEEPVIETQTCAISAAPESGGNTAGLIEQRTNAAPSFAQFAQEAPVHRSTETPSEPAPQPPPPTSPDSLQASDTVAPDPAESLGTDFALRSRSSTLEGSPSLPPASHVAPPISVPDDPSASPPNPSNAPGGEEIAPSPEDVASLSKQQALTNTEAKPTPTAANANESRPHTRPVSETAHALGNVRSPEAPRVPRRSAGSVPAANETVTATAAGTSTAKTSIRSNRPEEMGSPTRHTERTLPEAATLAAVSAESARTRTRSPSRPAPSLDNYSSAITSAVQAGSFAASRAATTLASGAEKLSVTSAGDVHRLEQRILGIVAEVQRLKPDSMSVVLKPDDQTELHLQLRIEGGSVAVEARVQRGDGATLGGQWAQLQQNLASQGVRLGDLQSPPAPQATGPDWSGGFSKQHREQPAREELPEPLREPALLQIAATVGKTKSTPKLDRRAWESWA